MCSGIKHPSQSRNGLNENVPSGFIQAQDCLQETRPLFAVFPSPPQMTQRKGQAKRWLCPCSLHLSDGSCLPPPRRLHKWAARQLGALSAAMCAAGQWARCTSRLPLRGAVNYKPICSTNRCSSACRILRWLQNPQKRELSRLRLPSRMGVCGRQTYGKTATTWSRGRWAGPWAEMAVT